MYFSLKVEYSSFDGSTKSFTMCWFSCRSSDSANFSSATLTRTCWSSKKRSTSACPSIRPAKPSYKITLRHCQNTIVPWDGFSSFRRWLCCVFFDSGYQCSVFWRFAVESQPEIWWVKIYVRWPPSQTVDLSFHLSFGCVSCSNWWYCISVDTTEVCGTMLLMRSPKKTGSVVTSV